MKKDEMVEHIMTPEDFEGCSLIMTPEEARNVTIAGPRPDKFHIVIPIREVLEHPITAPGRKIDCRFVWSGTFWSEIPAGQAAYAINTFIWTLGGVWK